MRRTLLVAAILILCGEIHVATAGPLSEYYITSGDQRTIHVIQGNSVNRSWGMVGTTRGGEYPIAVLNGFVRTADSTGNRGVGAEYTTAGVPTGNTYPWAFPGGSSFWDGTTDGQFNYAWDFSNGGLYQADTEWQNASQLFGGAGSGQYLGVTYDASDDTFWISGWSNDRIEHRDRSGALLGSFNTGVFSMAMLALDPADGTLWFGTQRQRGQFYQYSRTGSLLSTEFIPALTGFNPLGGEFEFERQEQVVPEPASIAVWSLLLLTGITVVYIRRRKLQPVLN